MHSVPTEPWLPIVFSLYVHVKAENPVIPSEVSHPTDPTLNNVGVPGRPRGGVVRNKLTRSRSEPGKARVA